jgi:hypothetical protein
MRQRFFYLIAAVAMILSLALSATAAEIPDGFVYADRRHPGRRARNTLLWDE